MGKKRLKPASDGNKHKPKHKAKKQKKPSQLQDAPPTPPPPPPPCSVQWPLWGDIGLACDNKPNAMLYTLQSAIITKPGTAGGTQYCFLTQTLGSTTNPNGQCNAGSGAVAQKIVFNVYESQKFKIPAVYINGAKGAPSWESPTSGGPNAMKITNIDTILALQGTTWGNNNQICIEITIPLAQFCVQGACPGTVAPSCVWSIFDRDKNCCPAWYSTYSG